MFAVPSPKYYFNPSAYEYGSKFIQNSAHFRYVAIPEEYLSYFPEKRLLSELEWRERGVQMSRGWQHVAWFRDSNNVMLFRQYSVPSVEVENRINCFDFKNKHQKTYAKSQLTEQYKRLTYSTPVGPNVSTKAVFRQLPPAYEAKLDEKKEVVKDSPVTSRQLIQHPPQKRNVLNASIRRGANTSRSYSSVTSEDSLDESSANVSIPISLDAAKEWQMENGVWQNLKNAMLKCINEFMIEPSSNLSSSTEDGHNLGINNRIVDSDSDEVKFKKAMTLVIKLCLAVGVGIEDLVYHAKKVAELDNKVNLNDATLFSNYEVDTADVGYSSIDSLSSPFRRMSLRSPRANRNPETVEGGLFEFKPDLLGQYRMGLLMLKTMSSPSNKKIKRMPKLTRNPFVIVDKKISPIQDSSLAAISLESKLCKNCGREFYPIGNTKIKSNNQHCRGKFHHVVRWMLSLRTVGKFNVALKNPKPKPV